MVSTRNNKRGRPADQGEAVNSEDVRLVFTQRSTVRETSRQVADQVRSADTALARYAVASPAPDRTETGQALLDAARGEAGQAEAQAYACTQQQEAIIRLEHERDEAKALQLRLVKALVMVGAVVVVIVALWWLIAG